MKAQKQIFFEEFTDHIDDPKKLDELYESFDELWKSIRAPKKFRKDLGKRLAALAAMQKGESIYLRKTYIWFIFWGLTSFVFVGCFVYMLHDNFFQVSIPEEYQYVPAIERSIDSVILDEVSQDFEEERDQFQKKESSAQESQHIQELQNSSIWNNESRVIQNKEDISQDIQREQISENKEERESLEERETQIFESFFDTTFPAWDSNVRSSLRSDSLEEGAFPVGEPTHSMWEFEIYCKEQWAIYEPWDIPSCRKGEDICTLDDYMKEKSCSFINRSPEIDGDIEIFFEDFIRDL